MVVSPQPLLTVVGVESLVMGVLAMTFAAIWLRSREAGMEWLAAGLAMTAAWYGYSARILYTEPDMETVEQRIAGIVIALSVLLISIGVVRYLGAPKGHLRWLLLACWAPAVVAILALVVSPAVPHRIFHTAVLVSYLGAATLAFRRSAQEPGDGHVLLGLALLSLPATPIVMAVTGIPSHQLAYVAGVSVIVFGLILLAVSLLRRQRALGIEVQRRAAAEDSLRDANARLEARVGERTAHLHELIGGLEAFNRIVSHDLRGPLGGMSSLAKMAAEAMSQGDPTMAQRALPLIATQCEASVQMVNAMLELARVGDTPVRRERIRMSDLARSAFDEVVLARPDRPRPAFHCNVMPLVMADPHLLRQVFVNLIGNAAKFSRESSAPRIDIDARVEGRAVTVCVSDNGVGFEPGVAERIFEPFYRAHDRRFEGHGLGLSIVRRAVEAMGGSVSAQSAKQGGASLCFKLPDAGVLEEAPHNGAAALI
jgi:signal transduction histidine kinase